MTYGSPEFREEISRSHDPVVKVEVVSIAGTPLEMYVLSGSVEVDRSATERRTCSLRCIDPTGEFTPEGPYSSVVPGAEVRPYRGVRYDNGDIELIPLGVFNISRVRVFANIDGINLDIESSDRSRRIRRDKFVTPYVIASGTNVIAAIQSIVERTFPNVEYDTVSTPTTTPTTLLYDTGDDPWDVITELATSIGCEAYFDREGRFVTAPTPTVETTPVFTFDTSKPNTTLSMSREFNDAPGYNGVVVECSSVGDTEEPLRVTVWDEDPQSPTYRHGPYGEVPYFHKDQIVRTVEEAEIVGRQILRSFLGTAAKLEINTLVNPDVEAGDNVLVRSSLIKVAGVYSAEAFNIPLGEDETQSFDLVRQGGVDS